MSLSIALVGNCQVTNLAQAVRVLLPDAEVRVVMIEKALRAGNCAEMAQAAAACDLILSQDLTREALGPLRTEALAQAGRPLQLFPKVLFTGFHPDAHNVFDGGRAVLSPLGAYHSEILIAAFLSGFELDRALGLFRGEVYQRLGYFREYPKSRDYLLDAAAALGFDFASEIDQWQSHGPFMHTFNHPNVRVMGSIARQALARLEVTTVDADLGAARDVLARSARWPLYPEVAERLGMTGDLVFIPPAADGAEPLSLAAFAARCYDIYRGLAPDLLTRNVHARRLDFVAGFG